MQSRRYAAVVLPIIGMMALGYAALAFLDWPAGQWPIDSCTNLVAGILLGGTVLCMAGAFVGALPFAAWSVPRSAYVALIGAMVLAAEVGFPFASAASGICSGEEPGVNPAGILIVAVLSVVGSLIGLVPGWLLGRSIRRTKQR